MPSSHTDAFTQAAHKAEEFLTTTLAQIRTDRAAPSLIEGVPVEAYGTIQPLKGLASISVADARSLVIQAWDPQLGPAIGKALAASPLGVNPTVEGGIVRLTLPVLTTERRTLLLRTINEKREDARITVRKARDEALRSIRNEQRLGSLSEDQAKAAERELEQLAQQCSTDIDTHVERKIHELGTP